MIQELQILVLEILLSCLCGYRRNGICAGRNIGKKTMSGWKVICWSLVISLPLVIPLTLLNFDVTHLIQVANDSFISILLFAFLCFGNNW
ncbi:MAG: hypothetical protein CM1200mP33_5570 [Chloroflexota bacterium]|nr:MAG: hypothetical protein CM1200mP33_5570 [Chloroflexota bacterium]